LLLPEEREKREKRNLLCKSCFEGMWNLTRNKKKKANPVDGEGAINPNNDSVKEKRVFCSAGSVLLASTRKCSQKTKKRKDWLSRRAVFPRSPGGKWQLFRGRNIVSDSVLPLGSESAIRIAALKKPSLSPPRFCLPR